MHIHTLSLVVLCGLLWNSPIIANVNAVTVISPYDVAAYDKDLTSIISQVHQFPRSVPDNIDLASRAFLGKPYLLGALGEGPTGQFDQSPLYRSDAFDCLTYVETVMALALSQDLETFKSTLKSINYQSTAISFQTRNHFMTLDWNPNNATQGYIQDITPTITDNGKKVTRLAETVIDRAGWYSKRYLSDLHLINPLDASHAIALLEKQKKLGAKYPKQKVSLPYLPLTVLFDKNRNQRVEIFNQIPSGSIIEIVRPNWDLTQSIGTHLNVSHVGLAIRTERGLMYRHASSTAGKIVELPLDEYLKDYLKSPTVKGINIQMVMSKK